MSTCTGRCSGCALSPGAKANLEVHNRIVGLLCALGGIPFYCHERLGWTPDRPNYPGGLAAVERAITDLRAAPGLIHNSPELAGAISDATATGLPSNIFDGARAVMGQTPACAGWKAAVARLADAGWFRDPVKRLRRRQLAGAAIAHVGQLTGKDSEKSKRLRQGLITAIGETLRTLGAEQVADVGGIVDLEGDRP